MESKIEYLPIRVPFERVHVGKRIGAENVAFLTENEVIAACKKLNSVSHPEAQKSFLGDNYNRLKVVSTAVGVIIDKETRIHLPEEDEGKTFRIDVLLSLEK